MGEEEFKYLLSGQAGDFPLIANGLLESAPEQWSQRQIYHLYRASTDLETFLDDFGARENRTFFPIREMAAQVRWLSLALTGLVHLDSRLPSYQVHDPAWSRDVLAPRVRRAALDLAEMTTGVLQALREAWLACGMPWAGHVLRVEGLLPGGPRPRLPRNLIEDREGLPAEGAGGSPAPARLINQYLGFLSTLERLGGNPIEGLAALRQFMSTRYTEELARSYEARAHNLQSSYDTWIAGTPEEEAHPELHCLRGAASQALHLLEAGTCLAHLYERHDVYGRHGGSRALFERVLPEERLLGVTVNHCARMAYECLKRTAPILAPLLRAFTHQISLELRLPEGVSLHARPISLIVSVVNHHGTPVEMEIEGRKGSAASIMQLLMLAGSSPNARMVRFTGDRAVLQDLQDLFERRLGEEGLDLLPPHLEYLRPSG
jgi:phosphotransferase system HPr (HPr) family protein